MDKIIELLPILIPYGIVFGVVGYASWNMRSEESMKAFHRRFFGSTRPE